MNQHLIVKDIFNRYITNIRNNSITNKTQQQKYFKVKTISEIGEFMKVRHSDSLALEANVVALSGLALKPRG